VTLADGATVIAKRGATVAIEAGMLRLLAEAQVPVPKIVATDGELLLIEDLGEDEGLHAAWGDLGRVLGDLHGFAGPGYGYRLDYGFGPVAILNQPHALWPDFWAERRLLPFCPRLPADLARRVESCAARLPDILPAAPYPSLLHGDLWAGNVMARGARITGLIDPACYFGHCEVDLAMLTLFASPPPEFWAAYGRPESGADARRAVYQLWPALVHYRLFGAGYHGVVVRCLDRIGA